MQAGPTATQATDTIEYMRRGLEEVRPPRNDDEKWYWLGAYLEVATKHDMPRGEIQHCRIFLGERDCGYHVSFVHPNWEAFVSFSGTRLVESIFELVATSARGPVRTCVRN